jgi:hypothetical protein
MRRYAAAGFKLDDPDRGIDPLRKAKYLVRTDAHPLTQQRSLYANGYTTTGDPTLFRLTASAG